MHRHHRMCLFFGTEVWNSLPHGENTACQSSPGHQYRQQLRDHRHVCLKWFPKRQENLPGEAQVLSPAVHLRPSFPQVPAVIKRDRLLRRRTPVKREGSSSVTARPSLHNSWTVQWLQLDYHGSFEEHQVFGFECLRLTAVLSTGDCPGLIFHCPWLGGGGGGGGGRQAALTECAPYSEAPPAPRPSDEGTRQRQLTPSLRCSTSWRKSASRRSFPFRDQKKKFTLRNQVLTKG